MGTKNETRKKKREKWERGETKKYDLRFNLHLSNDLNTGHPVNNVTQQSNALTPLRHNHELVNNNNNDTKKKKK